MLDRFEPSFSLPLNGRGDGFVPVQAVGMENPSSPPAAPFLSSAANSPAVSSSLTAGASYSDLKILADQLQARVDRLGRAGARGIVEARNDLREVKLAMLAAEVSR